MKTVMIKHPHGRECTVVQTTSIFEVFLSGIGYLLMTPFLLIKLLIPFTTDILTPFFIQIVIPGTYWVLKTLIFGIGYICKKIGDRIFYESIR